MKRLGLALSTLLAVLSGGLFWATRPAVSDDVAVTPEVRPEFDGWPKPDVVLLISGQQHGYVEPCGCTGLANQKGGLMRRDTLLRTLEQDRGWTIVPLDAGNQVRRSGAQAAIKFQFTIDALRKMQYRAVGLGPDDLRLPLGELLAGVTASMDEQGQSDLFVCANVNPLGFVATQRVIEAGGMRIGVTSVLGDAEAKRVTQAEIEIRPAEEGLREAVEQLKAQRCDFVVCMAQAPDEECHQLAKSIEGIDLMVAAAGVGEPRFQPALIPGTRTGLIQTGAKGMYVGAVGLFKTGNPRLRYQRIPLDARFVDSPRMLEAFAGYQGILKTQGLNGLGLKPVQHVQGKFVGSEACGDCHTRRMTNGSRLPTITPRPPSPNRPNDPRFPAISIRNASAATSRAGIRKVIFPMPRATSDLDANPALHGSGCENCHGPGQAHVAAENGEGDFSDADIEKLRTQMRLELSKAEQRCMECHDLDNSPDFHLPGAFEKYWKAVEHPGRD